MVRHSVTWKSPSYLLFFLIYFSLSGCPIAAMGKMKNSSQKQGNSHFLVNYFEKASWLQSISRYLVNILNKDVTLRVTFIECFKKKYHHPCCTLKSFWWIQFIDNLEMVIIWSVQISAKSLFMINSIMEIAITSYNKRVQKQSKLTDMILTNYCIKVNSKLPTSLILLTS